MPLPTPSDTSTAVVTGASAGIGEQFARRLSARGHHAVVRLATASGRSSPTAITNPITKRLLANGG